MISSDVRDAKGVENRGPRRVGADDAGERDLRRCSGQHDDAVGERERVIDGERHEDRRRASEL
ncbi:MAG: hypothetical protein JO036_05215 [Candidatus Eremiobacteraeota bacterium]|nr:hypothetical protein [Candidatus Eremiobacteraeota bacterium]